MPEWCPKCKAMLPPGLETCPACGAKLAGISEDKQTGRDIFWLSAYIIGIALIPILIALGVGLLCVLLNQ